MRTAASFHGSPTGARCVSRRGPPVEVTARSVIRPMKRTNRDDTSDESSGGGLCWRRRRRTHRKRVFQQVQHRPARSAVMLLRMVDDEEFTRRQGGLDGDDADAAACEVLGDGEPGHHRDTKARHHSTFHAVGMVERHRSCRGKAMTVPPGGHLTPCVGSFFAQEPRLRLELAGLQRPRPYQHRARGRDDQQVVVRHTSRGRFAINSLCVGSRYG